jgi:hypothetical protein
MKTAMQELLDELKEYQLEFNIPIEVIDMCESQLNVEKEQIITAFEVGYKSCDLDETFEINRKLASGELHYNKTYK